MSKNIHLTLALFILGVFPVVAQKIDVLTYNIRYASFDQGPQNWDERKEGVISILKAHDFVGMQEVLPVQMEDIKQKIGDEYGILFRTREADSTKGEGSPVLYNKKRWELLSSGFHWLSDTPEIPGSNTWGAAFNRIVSFGIFKEHISGDSVLVVNTHFDHVSQSAREKSIGLILNQFNTEINEIPVVLMGDFNITPENPVYQRIIAMNTLTDSYKESHPGESISGATFHGWKDAVPSERIDYIFSSEGLRIISSEVLHTRHNDIYPSDHFPLNTVLKLK